MKMNGLIWAIIGIIIIGVVIYFLVIKGKGKKTTPSPSSEGSSSEG